MVVEALWTKRALTNLNAELEYYGQINPKLAKDLAEVVKNSIEKLMFMPGVGRAGKLLGSKEFILDKYPFIIAYRVRENILEILAFIHQRRKNVKAFY